MNPSSTLLQECHAMGLLFVMTMVIPCFPDLPVLGRAIFEESRAIYNLHVFRPSYGTVVLVFCDH